MNAGAPDIAREPKADIRGPVRTCVGCAARVDTATESLVRLIQGPDGAIAVDASGSGFGRGAHLHPRPACIAGAAARGLARSFKGSGLVVQSASGAAPLSHASLAAAICEAMNRRLVGLMGSAVRARAIALGADAVTGACQRNEARLVVVACDAAAAADLTEVRRAVAEGRGVAWGDKQTLAALCHKGRATGEGLGVVAITSKHLASAIAEAVRAADAVAATGEQASRGGAVRHEGSRPAKPRGITRGGNKGVRTPGVRGKGRPANG
jgi:predicted RNA-binding protein YlxR (DUF448 family)/ribosomal protein L7Ae-like RNA K-turn-binding protein